MQIHFIYPSLSRKIMCTINQDKINKITVRLDENKVKLKRRWNLANRCCLPLNRDLLRDVSRAYGTSGLKFI